MVLSWRLLIVVSGMCALGATSPVLFPDKQQEPVDPSSVPSLQLNGRYGDNSANAAVPKCDIPEVADGQHDHKDTISITAERRFHRKTNPRDSSRSRQLNLPNSYKPAVSLVRNIFTLTVATSVVEVCKKEETLTCDVSYQNTHTQIVKGVDTTDTLSFSKAVNPAASIKSMIKENTPLEEYDKILNILPLELEINYKLSTVTVADLKSYIPPLKCKPFKKSHFSESGSSFADRDIDNLCNWVLLDLSDREDFKDIQQSVQTLILQCRSRKPDLVKALETQTRARQVMLTTDIIYLSIPGFCMSLTFFYIKYLHNFIVLFIRKLLGIRDQ